MRKALHLPLLLLLLTGCSSSTTPATTRPSASTRPTASSSPDTITLATYNVEHFADHFRGFHMEQQAATRPANPETKDLVDAIKRWNTENQWEIANVITDPAFSPDILCIEEGPEQSDLDFFNKRWLDSMYATVIVFPSNSQYHQTVDMLLKPGFKILDRKDRYYLEPDSAGQNKRGERLFARGPAFLRVQAPSGYTFWVGVTHQKSKSGNSLEVSQWRVREAKRTHEILKELRAIDPDVVLLGDMNDDLGPDEYESKPDSGGDSIAALVGPPSDGFLLATKPLADKKEISFHGYSNPKYRSLIDHAIVSPDVSSRLRSVQIFQNQWTPVASDHLPVMLKINAAPTAQQ